MATLIPNPMAGSVPDKTDDLPDNPPAPADSGVSLVDLAKWIQENKYERIKEAIQSKELDANATFVCSTTGKIAFTNMTPVLVGVHWEHHSGVIGKDFTETPLTLAIASGSIAIVSLLLDSSANTETRASELNCTPLFLALCLKREDAASLLLKRGANAKYTQPILFKEMNKHTLGFVRAPCRDVAKINAVPRAFDFFPVVLGTSVTPLHIAAIVGVSAGLIKELMTSGADVRAQAHFVARTYGQHMWQMCCTREGIMTTVLCGFMSLCTIPVIETLVLGCCLPGTHNPSCGHPMPTNITRTAWELARDFDHPFPIEAMARSDREETGAPKEDLKPGAAEQM